MSGYATVTRRSIVDPLADSSTGVMTHCHSTADSATATIALSIALSRSNLARASWISAIARIGYAGRYTKSENG